MLTKRFYPLYLVCSIFTITLFTFYPSTEQKHVLVPLNQPLSTKPPPADLGSFQWAQRKENYPVSSVIPMPSGKPVELPTIQFQFGKESRARTAEIASRRDAVKASFDRAWEGYKSKAWMKDELAPISGTARDHFGGWAATLVDSLDTLWIMDKKADFEQAVEALKDIDFTTTEDEELNTFETTIRYLGGLLAASDLSNGTYPILLEKALGLGHLIYGAFDTPNRMPLTRWHWNKAKAGEAQDLNRGVIVAELGSLSLEFTRLSQVSGDPKFFDAIQRISDRFEEAQPLTLLPGLWPVFINPSAKDFGEDNGFSIGAMADSLYEYFPKQYILLGGLSQQPKRLYESFIHVAKQHFFFRPMVPDEADILISGNIRVISGTITLDPQGQHLACFIGGMVAIASRIFDRPDELALGRKLTDGCIWAYKAMPSGIMPEMFQATPCAKRKECPWNAKIADSMVGFPGFTGIGDARYILRPEAIESVFILYRITGDERLRDQAWDMFQAIEKHTKVEYGSGVLVDVTSNTPLISDSMESFWTAETLKYFYLIFSPQLLISLDDYVLNTEAHPFKRPR